MNNIHESYDKSLKQILKKTRVNFLLGAGASHYIEEGQLSYPLMKDLVKYIISNEAYNTIIKELKDDNIIIKCHNQYMLKQMNFEIFLSALEGLTNYPLKEAKLGLILSVIELCKKLVIERILRSNTAKMVQIYSAFYQSLLSFNKDKEENFKRTNIFTTNYDMLNELALEELSIFYFAGFSGLNKRRFNPAYYNFTYSDDMNLNTRNYLVKNDHINLYKLHGSLSWIIKNGELNETQDFTNNSSPVIIYPSHTKYNNTNLIVYYSTLMREFLNQLSKEQTTLVTIGYSFSDEHINQLIESALSIERFTLVACLYSDNDLVNINKRFPKQSNLMIFKGHMSTLDFFGKFLEDETNEQD